MREDDAIDIFQQLLRFAGRNVSLERIWEWPEEGEDHGQVMAVYELRTDAQDWLGSDLATLNQIVSEHRAEFKLDGGDIVIRSVEQSRRPRE